MNNENMPELPKHPRSPDAEFCNDELRAIEAYGQACYNAGRAAAIPAGMMLVPVEPDDAMQTAGAQAVRMDTTALNRIWTGNAVYRAMLAAAPSQPAVKPVPDLDQLALDTATKILPMYFENIPGAQLKAKIQCAVRDALDSRQPVAASAKDAEDAAHIGAVLAYSVTGHGGIGGQAIGADGAGDFVVIFHGTTEQADAAARLHIREIEQSRQKFKACILVHNEEGWFGPMIKHIDAAIAATKEES